MTDHGAIARLAERLKGEPIDILLNNAAIARPHPGFGETDYALWRRILETNLIGPMKMAECFVEHVARSELKVMAFVSSRMGSIGSNNSGGSYAYRSSKAGLNMIAKSLAVDLAPREICVLALHPGWAMTEPGATGARGRERSRHAGRDPSLRPAFHRKFLDLPRSTPALVRLLAALFEPQRLF